MITERTARTWISRDDDGLIERWREVVRYEGFYRVSDKGRVKSLAREVFTVDKKGRERTRISPGKMLKQHPINNITDHLKVGLCKNGKTEEIQVHRLVLEAFIGPCPTGMESCHNNDQADDNRVNNLRWDTRSNNTFDKYKNKGVNQAIGERSGMAKLTEEKVLEIRKLASRGLMYKDIAVRFDVCAWMISCIVRRKYWTHI